MDMLIIRCKSCEMGVKSLRIVVVIVSLLQIISLTMAQSNRPLEYWIREEDPANSMVGNVLQGAKLSEKYDEDVLNTLRFSFRSSTGHYQHFNMEEGTGIIRTSHRINREDVCPYSAECDLNLDITVRPLQYFQIIKVVIHVEDINDNVPTFPSHRMQLDITETTMPGAMFSIPSAEDMDSGLFGVQKYQMHVGINKFELKVTDHFDGTKDVRLELKQKLDREEEDYYSLQIVASDGGDPPKEGTLIVDINVSDANDNNPKFGNYTYEAQIYENLPIGTRIAQVHASDPDFGPNGEVVYSLAPHTMEEYGHLFGVDNKTGEIVIRGIIDYEEKKVYHLTVVASDMGPNSLPAYTKVIVNVLDENDHAPQIAVNTLTETGVGQVKENEPSGTFVAHVAVTDPDIGQNGQFTCSIVGEKFHLEELSGTNMYKITTNFVFDRERQDEFMVTLQCSDKGNPPKTSTKHLTVKILDANDHTPVLPKAYYLVFLKENNTLNDTIIKINASDRDIGKNAAIKYQIEGLADTSADLVSMDSVSGEIRATTIFDHEKRQYYQFLIIASDHADEPRTATATLNLTVVDVNDEYPLFSQHSYSFEMQENEAANSPAGQVSATDDDSYPFNKIVYSIDPQKSNTEAFDIDTHSGKIIANKPLDREAKDTYLLAVVASNEGFPNINATVNVSVNILDKNDNPPTILFPSPENDTVSISNRVPKGYLVTRIEAIDKDLGENAKISFDIANGNEDESFVIDHLTGAISLATDSFKKIDHKQIKLIIIVKDEGTPEKISIADLNIEIDKNVPYTATAAQTGPRLLEGNNLIILIGVIAGLLLVVIFITVSVLCVRARQRRIKKAHQYNCRLEASKSLSNGSITKEGLHSSSCSENGSDQSIDNVHVIGLKTKERTKKEVTFSLDMDDAFIDKIPANWPLHTADSKVIENPHAHNSGVGPANARSRPEGARPQNRGRHGVPHDRPRRPHHSHHRHPHGASSWVREQAQAANVEKPARLTEGDLEMHDMLNLSQNTDHDSESGCSGSYTDSGRGPSEEGDNFGLHIDPFYGESKNGGSKADSSSSSSSGKDNSSDSSPPSVTGKTHMNIPNLDSPRALTPPVGGANLKLKTFAPLPKEGTPKENGVVNNLNKDYEGDGNQLPPYPTDSVPGNVPRWHGENKPNPLSNYKPSPNASHLRVLDRPSQYAKPLDTRPGNYLNVKKKGVRFAEKPSVIERGCPLAGDEDYASSVDGLSDDGTTTSGSYIVSDNNEADLDNGRLRMDSTNQGTVV